MKSKMETVKLTVCEGLQVSVQPSREHEFMMTTAEVAKGYGVSLNAIIKHKSRYSKELTEGKHYLRGVVTNSHDLCKSNSYNDQNQIYWTKRGIVRLGFFIKSERARLFRDWAEDLIIAKIDGQPADRDLWGNPIQLIPGRRARRVSNRFVIDLLQDIAHIEDKDVRIRITQKLLKQRYGTAE